MKVTFLGAAREVTGSCTLLEAAGRRLLVDFGVEQGKDVYENAALPIEPGEVDALLITHAHMDHIGRVPYFFREGYCGPIYATTPTTELCELRLAESAEAQEQDADYQNRKNQRSGAALVEPAYTLRDIQSLMTLFCPLPYDTWEEIYPGIELCFTDSGHMLGSAAITLRVTEEGRTETITFSGDIGNTGMPLLRDPVPVPASDYLVMESTFGDRYHAPRRDPVPLLAQVVQRTLDRGGNVLIPSAAIGRTQELLYYLRRIKNEQRVRDHGDFPVYVDGPQAAASTEIFRDNYRECYDEEALAMAASGRSPLTFTSLYLCETPEESRALNDDPTPKVIIAASAACESGRICHHLKYNLWRPESTVLFTGYPGPRSLGRAILDGEPEVTLFGESVSVRAEALCMACPSTHADRGGLQGWLEQIEPRPAYIFVNHGDEDAATAWADYLQTRGYHAEAPYTGALYELAGGRARCLAQGNTRRIGAAPAPTDQLARLRMAGQRIQSIIARSGQRSETELAAFANALTALCERWKL